MTLTPQFCGRQGRTSKKTIRWASKLRLTRQNPIQRRRLEGSLTDARPSSTRAAGASPNAMRSRHAGRVARPERCTRTPRRASRRARVQRFSGFVSGSTRVEEGFDERPRARDDANGAAASVRNGGDGMNGAVRARTALCAGGRQNGHQLPQRLLLVALPLQQLPLLVLAHLLAALLDHTTHDRPTSLESALFYCEAPARALPRRESRAGELLAPDAPDRYVRCARESPGRAWPCTRSCGTAKG
jgi:hypothetical protein